MQKNNNKNSWPKGGTKNIHGHFASSYEIDMLFKKTNIFTNDMIDISCIIFIHFFFVFRPEMDFKLTIEDKEPDLTKLAGK